MRHDTKSRIDAICKEAPAELLLKGSDGFYHLQLEDIDHALADILGDRDAEYLEEGEDAEYMGEDDRKACFDSIMQLLRVYRADGAEVERLVQLTSGLSVTWKDFFFDANNPPQAFEAARCGECDTLAVVGEVTWIGTPPTNANVVVIALSELTVEAMSRSGHITVSIYSDQLDIFEKCKVGDEIIAIGRWEYLTDPNGYRHMHMKLVAGDQFRRVVRPDNYHLEREYLCGNDGRERIHHRDYGLEM